MKNKRAQAATEFIMLIGLSMIFLMAFTIITMTYAQEALEEERRQALLDMGYAIQEELISVTIYQEGLTKRLDLPTSLGSFNYEITSTSQSIELTSSTLTQTFKIPTINGIITKGENTITYDGVITITQ